MTSAAEPPGRPGSILEGPARFLLPALLAALVAFSVHRLACAPLPPSEAELRGEALGTTWTVKVAEAELSAEARATAVAAVEGALARVDASMSTWRSDSELSRFNASAAGRDVPVSPETIAVFRIAEEVNALTGGAFDVTVGPLVAAWGFGASGRIPAPPDPDELARARALVGGSHLTVGATSLRKDRDGVACDLSAIAKGYAVDLAAEALRSLGHRDFLVEVGGELRAAGRRLDGLPWRVAIERPDSARRGVFAVVALDDSALATSGDYRDFYESGGKRYSHTIDPRTGRPVEHRLASVSVLHAEAVWADALATGLNVLGPEAGYALAEARGWAAYFLVRGEAEGAFTVRATPGFEAALSAAEAGRPEAAR